MRHRWWYWSVQSRDRDETILAWKSEKFKAGEDEYHRVRIQMRSWYKRKPCDARWLKKPHDDGITTRRECTFEKSYTHACVCACSSRRSFRKGTSREFRWFYLVQPVATGASDPISFCSFLVFWYAFFFSPFFLPRFIHPLPLPYPIFWLFFVFSHIPLVLRPSILSQFAAPDPFRLLFRVTF